MFYLELLVGVFSPNIAYASVDSFISNVDKQIINPLIIFLFVLALAYFLYGVFKFVANSESEESKTEGRNAMLWGIIGLTIMMGVWTILSVIMKTFNINGINPEQGTVTLPSYTPSSSSFK